MNDEFPPVKFLVIRFSSIGDIVLTTPLIRCLKEQVSGAEVHFLTKKNFANLVTSNPAIDKVHLFDNNLSTLLNQLRGEEFHYIIDLHHNLRSARIKLGLGVLAFSFDKQNFNKYLLVRLKINRLPDVHIVDRYLDTVRLFDVENDGKGLDFFIPEQEEINLGDLPEMYRSGYIAMVTGAKHQTKQMPVELMIGICKGLRLPVILLGGKEDRERAEEVVNKTVHSYNACGKFSLLQSASLLRQAQLVISPDTGLMHIASALKKTVISIWGNTIPEFGMYPYLPGNHSRIFEIRDLSCRPCSKLGYRACPKGHFKCMNGISSTAIVDYIHSILKS